jgi:hypothetical protein
MFSTQSALRSYRKLRQPVSSVPQGKLRRDGAILYLRVDEASAKAAVTREREHVKQKNLHC